MCYLAIRLCIFQQEIARNFLGGFIFMNKKFIGLGLASVALLSLAACGNRGASKSDSKDAKTDLKVAMVTDTGGVDDKSFNQSAWEGLQAWGKENGLKKG